MSIRLNSSALLLLFAAVLTSPAIAQDKASNQGEANRPTFVTGDLGSINASSQASLHASAKSALQLVLNEQYEADGREEMIVTKVIEDKIGGHHIRFEQKLNGLPVAGTGMVIHADIHGSVFAVNGDFVPSGDLPLKPDLSAIEAFGLNDIKGTKNGKPELSYVLGSDGIGHLAWKATFEYINEEGPQRDIVFVDASTGKIAARHPQILYARKLNTQDCQQRTRRCKTVSRSSNVINTSDLAINSAHNYAIATYNYYLNNHGRDSIDDKGMTLKSRVHFGLNYNNAFWDGSQMTYGDGDGVNFIPLSQDADVVAHELTHGVTERSSGLIYQNESGALSEAWSDIFGAMVDRQEGATGADIWFIGEDIYTPMIPGDALRNMADPAAFGDYDYYPTRYMGGADNGGVHWNSGIANLAFKLLVTGGTHPRGETSVNVTPIGFDAAADIFYAANIGCLTPSSNFATARYCTAIFAGSNEAAVNLAWDAVGVPNHPPIQLQNDVATAPKDGEIGDIQYYLLSGVNSGETVTCTTSCDNGDADLYLRFNGLAETNPNSGLNECGSYSTNSNESCTTGAASSDGSTLNAAVHGFSAYTNLSLTCTISSNNGGSCPLLDLGSSCTSNSQCCSDKCKGKPGSKTCK
ncbi:M4 family metallopeptidase [Shewanella violacea]|uniref:Neutral metalloproteinase n=1 Tax=Shewanella violacea (strain JCM 10179 / CIP 106290 / LMG 19151 / DSS12) TaxID=637905 RepID=D4ZG12_SHEVD|nr:M4 family metallopeptidase [Shewanella violacea]BAJ00611.1 thermolysin metallopeptidase family [Shewanella violacea DSS12]